MRTVTARARKTGAWVAVLVALAGAGLAQADPRDERAREHEHVDARFHHDRAYPDHGRAFYALPAGRRYDFVRGPDHYYFAGGVWYVARGPSFVVVAPPIGVYVPFLPPYYTTVWVAGVPYYYANDTYYAYAGPTQGYQVMAAPGDATVASQAPPPPDASQYPPPDAAPQYGAPDGAPPPPAPGATYQSPPPAPGAAYQAPPPGQAAYPASPPPTSDNVFVYPRNGQSPDQQARDRYECHSWAVAQSGFNPSTAGGGVSPQDAGPLRADYNRALSACLDGRGYTVK